MNTLNGIICDFVRIIPHISAFISVKKEHITQNEVGIKHLRHTENRNTKSFESEKKRNAWEYLKYNI